MHSMYMPRHLVPEAPTAPDALSLLMQAMQVTDQSARSKVELERAKIAQSMEDLISREHPEDRERKMIREALENEALKSKTLFEGQRVGHEGERLGLEKLRIEDVLRSSEVERAAKGAMQKMHEVQTDLLPRELDIKEKSVDAMARHYDVANAIRREVMGSATSSAGNMRDKLVLMDQIMSSDDIDDTDKGGMVLRLAKEMEAQSLGQKFAPQLKDNLRRRLGEYAATTSDERLKRLFLSHIKPDNEASADIPLDFLKSKIKK